MSTVQHREVLQQTSIINMIYHSVHVQIHDRFSMPDQSLSLETSVSRLTCDSYTMWSVEFNKYTLINVCVCVHIYMFRWVCVCVCSTAKPPCFCPGVEPQAEGKLYLYWPTCYLLFWEPVMHSFLSLWWCRKDVVLRHHMSPPFKTELSSLLFYHPYVSFTVL